MAVRVKICGITHLDDALAAVAAGADALGFVFVPGTPRAVTAEQAAAITRQLPAGVARVGLFVNAGAELIRSTLAAAGLDSLQLHGDEPPEFCRQFRGAGRVWKAFRVRGAATLAQLPAYADAADAFLLDAFVPGAHGGTGARFDWAHAVTAGEAGRPVILAGGLTPQNVAEAVRAVRPWAVDVSSGVEAAPGRKDVMKMRAFIAAAKAA